MGNPEITNSKIRCKECGKEFRNLGQHIICKHFLSAREYKKKWGLCNSQPLECKETTAIRKRKTLENKTYLNVSLVNNGHRFLKGDKAWQKRGIPEQAYNIWKNNFDKSYSHKKNKIK